MAAAGLAQYIGPMTEATLEHAAAERAAATPEPESARRNLIGLSRADLAAELAPLGIEGFRVRQLWHWIYCRGARSFAAMTTLAKPVRARLEERYTLGRPDVAAAQRSRDGTRKWLLRFADGQEVETVHIPEEDRGTLCVSSQVGCRSEERRVGK